MARPLDRHTGLTRILVCGLVLAWIGAASAAARDLELRVRYRSADTVYLEGGSSVGLAVGDRLTVVRDGDTIAEIEVVFAAERSASCRVVSEDAMVRTGDVARLSIEFDASEEDPVSPAAPIAAATASASSGQTVSRGSAPAVSARQRRTRVSGLVSLDWESFSDGGDSELDFDRLSVRLSLRARDIGGLPLSLRVRGRTQQLERSRDLGRGATTSETRDRLYEVSLRYDAPNDRFSLMGGRLGTSPFVGIGFLDGLLGEVRLFKSLRVGGFWGARPDITELGFESSGQKYGAYTRIAASNATNGRSYEVVLGGIVEEGETEVSREYGVIEAYYNSGGRWSLYQRAEIDVNSDWREELADSSTELSNLALSVRTQLTPTARLVVSYDQFRQYRTEETRFIPEELFNALLRQGLRLGVHWGQPRAMSWSVTGGWRDQEDGEEPSLSLGIGARHPNVGAGIALSGDLLGFSNEFTEGAVIRARGSRRFGAGHEVYVDVGGRFSASQLLEDGDTSDSWVRLGSWVELPANLFARAELEFAAGDNLEGSRVSLGVGYRF